MFDRFTDHARKTMGLSHQEAQRYHHDYIGPEHFLLGLLLVGDSAGVEVLGELDVDTDQLGSLVESRMTQATIFVTMGQLPFTPRAKKVLELALEEASNLGHNYIGSEHLLLGLIRERHSIAAAALAECGVELVPARDAILEVLARSDEDPDTESAAPTTLPPMRSGDPLKDEVARARERIGALEERVKRLEGPA
ncbi:MAG: Clp protease N-terminal domain-containing protein [Planctomycetota bacterium]